MKLFASNSSFASLLSVLGVISTGAHAQERFDVENSATATTNEGSVLNVYGGRTLERGAYGLALGATYGRKPLTLESPSGQHLADLIGSEGTLEILGAIGVTNAFEVGLGVPFHRNAAGSEFAVAPPRAVRDSTLASSKVAMGDIRVVPRLGLLRHSGPAGFNLAAVASLWLPTGSDAAYAGESVRVEPRLALDYQTRTWLVAFNAGYLIRREARLVGNTFDDQLRFGVGADVGVGKGLSILGEIDTQLNVLADDFGSSSVATEALAGLRYRAKGGLSAQLGGGPALTHGLNAPMYRISAALGWSGTVVKPILDSDRDDLLDDVDRCVDQAEDRDDFQDQDGCPDLDNDDDGVADVSDRCPQAAEDRDGFDDADGCPDSDNDGDGLADAADSCPQQAEDRDGFQDDDGCPDSDNDGDGVADATDRCPIEAGTAETNGCPAPVVAEPQSVVVSAERIELKENVLFGSNNATIAPESFALLDSIAGVMVAHPEVEHVVVEGHTDSRGNTARNMKLSEQRAQSVMDALIQRGVQATRLSSLGFGATRPLVPNDTPENLAKNRRVELRIDRRAP